MLLRSLKPSLHMNVDCTALFAAIVSRQVAVVQQLLQVPLQLLAQTVLNVILLFSRICKSSTSVRFKFLFRSLLQLSLNLIHISPSTKLRLLSNSQLLS